MRRTDQIEDINTPERYDELFFGERTIQMLAFPHLIKILSDLNTNKGNVLDIGCGLGRYFCAFEGSKIFATELSLRSIQKAKEDYPDATIIQWFAKDPLPFNDDFFNLIWAGEFLEHLTDPKLVVKEIYRVLAPGGKAVFVTPVGQNSITPEHLWFFDRNDIDEIFKNYEHKEISIHNSQTGEVQGEDVFESRFHIILTK